MGIKILSGQDLVGPITLHRKKAGLNQAELALMAGVSRTSIQRLETGKGAIQLETLLAILTVLNISLLIEGPYTEA